MTTSSIRARRLRAAVAAASVVVAAATLTAAMQQTPSLASLTVPASKLPADCGLRPETPRSTQTVSHHATAGPFVIGAAGRPNPWTGDSARTLVAIRKDIDGAPRYSDALMPTLGQMSAIEAKWNEHVVEGYRAEYVSGNATVRVAALRFDSAAHAAESTPNPIGLGHEHGFSARHVMGAIVAKVTGPVTPCFSAIERYIGSLQ